MTNFNVLNRSAATPFIELQHVSVAREGKAVLHDLCLRIDAGECVAIVGPNGCGKSTLIKTLTGELYPLATLGMNCRVFGRERWDLSELRRRLGIVSADAPSPTMLGNTGLEAVLTGFFSSARLWPHLVVTSRMRQHAAAALAEVDATSLASQPLSAMSAGQQRRISIARALVAMTEEAPPHVLLLDEPSNALDLAAQRDLRQTLRRLARLGTGLLLITHRLEDIIPEMDRVLLMRDGRIAADGRKQDLLTPAQLQLLFDTKVDVAERDGYFYAW